MNSALARLFLVLLLGMFLGVGVVVLFINPGESTRAGPEALNPPGISSVEERENRTGNLPVVDSKGEPSLSGTMRESGGQPVLADPRSAKATRQPQSSGVAEALAPALSGAIFGRVTDEGGQPLRGVVLRLEGSKSRWNSVQPSSLGGGAPAPSTLAQTLAKARENFERRLADRYETVSDARGNYRLENLPKGPWSMGAYLPGYLVESEDRFPHVAPGSELNFTGRVVVDVPVEVYDRQGVLAEAARVEWRAMRRVPTSIVFEANGDENFLRLGPGEYQVTAFGIEALRVQEADSRSETQTLHLEAGQPSPTLRFDLRERLSLHGVLRVAEGDPAIDFSYVHWMLLGPNELPELDRLANSNNRTYVSPGSRYRFSDLEPGRYFIGARRSFLSEIDQHVVIELSTQSVQHDFLLNPLERSRYIRATVVVGEGRVPGRVRFSMSDQSGDFPRVLTLETVTMGGGFFLLGLQGDDLDEYFDKSKGPGVFFLTAEGKEHGFRTVQLEPAQEQVEIDFSSAATLEVTVAGYAGSELEGRLIVVAEKADGSQENLFHTLGWGARVNSEGIQKWDQLEPGSYVLQLQALPLGVSKSEWYKAKAIGTLELEVNEGANRARMNIPDMETLLVHWDLAESGAKVSMRSTDGSKSEYYSVEFDEQQLATFEFLEPGEYRIRTSGKQGGSMTVSVPSGVVEFVPK